MRLYHPTEIVIETLDVRFAEQRTALHLDDLQVFVAGCGAMQAADGDGEGVARADVEAGALTVDPAAAAGDDPVLTAMQVALQAEATPGKNQQAFDAIALASRQGFKPSPGPFSPWAHAAMGCHYWGLRGGIEGSWHAPHHGRVRATRWR